VSDVDDDDMESAVVCVSSGLSEGDVLSFVDTMEITGMWNSGSGELTLTGSASIGLYVAALQSVTYSSVAASPASMARVVEIVVSDGGASSNVVSRSITIVRVGDTPSVTPSDVTTMEDVDSEVIVIEKNAADTDIGEVTHFQVSGIAGGQVFLVSSGSEVVSGDFIEKSRDDVKVRLNEIAGMVPGGEAMVVTGHSARSILEWADTHGNDCIIVSSHKPGVQDYFLGGTAARVVRYAQCAVHVVR
jgi:nucleotide-binding universal stress UspA family protein